ncbi:MAG: ATP-binding protein, partial [Acidimicrobiia bacterium]|nr:ATP-binding protein [Acidimicrobiia bacterium]
LAVIQRRSGSPDEVVSLARGQERDLRSWLYGSTGGPESFESAVAEACSEVEATYHIPVDVVVVGAARMSPGLEALVSAVREAVVNAARHSGAPSVSVYAEVEVDAVRAFVRDRGSGFDPEAVPSDRQGITNSIVGRMSRHGGEGVVRSKPGTGTEAMLTMPL